MTEPNARKPEASQHTGVLHMYVAFDWGQELDLRRARDLAAGEVLDLPRRRRTPSSFTYRPPPLRVILDPVPINVPEVGVVKAPAEVTLFDFGAVSMALSFPFELQPEQLLSLANQLAEPVPFVQAARSALRPLFEALLPALEQPLWQEDLYEEYFVFHFAEDVPLLNLDKQDKTQQSYLARLVRLDSTELSDEEIAEALRVSIRYSRQDLFIADWAAAVLSDRDCEETLQTIEFANLQLLEFRYIDSQLEAILLTAYGIIHRLAKARLPIWRSHGKALRTLGELKVEANEIFERTNNVLKLVGDQYLARVYRHLASRFHLHEWQESIERKLEVAEGVYQVVSDQTDTYRGEFLEVTVVALIVLEVLLAIIRH